MSEEDKLVLGTLAGVDLILSPEHYEEYKGTLNKQIEDLQQKVEQLENIIKEASEYINHAQNYGTMAQVMPHLKHYINGDNLLNILNKGSESNVV